MTARLSLLLTLIISPLAYASAPDCLYRGEDVLQCDGNIIVAAGTLVTQDQPVMLITPKAVVFGSKDGVTHITCADAGEAAPQSEAKCGKVAIWANTLYGALDVKAKAEGREAGAIELNVGTYAADFKMNLDTEKDLLFIQRSGKDHTADDATLRWASR